MTQETPQLAQMKSLPDQSVMHYGVFLRDSVVEQDYPLHWHDYYELELVVDGEGVQWLNGRRIPMSKGCLYLLRPADLHRIRAEQPIRVYSAKLFVADLQVMLQKLLFGCAEPAHAKLAEADYRQTLSEFLMLKEELDHALPNGEISTHALISLLLIRLLRNTPEEGFLTLEPSIERFRLVLRYIQEHCMSALSLGEVAAAAGLSPNYLSHCFTRFVGCRFTEYVVRQRIRQAQILLVESSQSVTEIAYACGFGSLSHFLRTFHRTQHMTPGEYRRSIRR